MLRKRTNQHILIILIITIIAYIPSHKGDFFYDDIHSIVKNEHLRIEDLSPKSLLDAGFGNEYFKLRPLPLVTFALNYYFFGEDTLSFHIFNLIIHLIAATALYFLIFQILSLERFKGTKIYENASLVAFMVASLWAVAPVNVQAVTYIVQRMASMAGMFYFLSLLFFIKWRKFKIELDQSKALYLILSIFFALCAFLSKQNSFMLLFIMFFSEWILFQKGKLKWLLKASIYLIGAIVLLAIVYTYLKGDHQELKVGLLEQLLNNRYSVRDFTPLDRILIEPRIVLYYITLILFPFVGRFHLIYDFDWLNAPWQIWTYLSIILILGLIVFALSKVKKYPLLSLSILFFFVNHAIESTFIGLQLAFEHRNYIPSVGVFLIISLLLHHLFLKTKKYFYLVFIVILSFSLLNTFMLNLKYSSEGKNAFYDYKSVYTKSSDYIVVNAVYYVIMMQQYDTAKTIAELEFYQKEYNRHYDIMINNNDMNLMNLYFRTYLLTSESTDIVKGDLENLLLNSDLAKNLGYLYYLYGLYLIFLENEQKINDFSTSLKDFFSITYKGELRDIQTEDNFNLDRIDKLNENLMTEDESHINALYLFKNGFYDRGLLFEYRALDLSPNNENYLFNIDQAKKLLEKK